MIPFPLWSPEWWITVALCGLGAVALLWLLCRNSLLLQQIVWPPIIEGGHHTSKRWKEVRDARLKRSSGRCVICGAKGEKTWHLFSVQRRGWGWRIIAARSTSRKPPVHETLYAWVRNNSPVPKRYLWIMCPTHHNALHAFDKWLVPWDKRNRLLPFTSVMYRGGWYSIYLSVLAALGIGALWFFRPDVARHLATIAGGMIR